MLQLSRRRDDAIEMLVETVCLDSGTWNTIDVEVGVPGYVWEPLQAVSVGEALTGPARAALKAHSQLIHQWQEPTKLVE